MKFFLKSLWIFLTTIILLYLLVPFLVHKMTLWGTPTEELKNNQLRYQEVLYEINGKPIDQNADERKELDSLYLWFHVRGLPIDEGHEGVPLSKRWSELIEYYFL